MSPNEVNDSAPTVRGAVMPRVARFRNSVRNVKSWLAQHASAAAPSSPVQQEDVPANLSQATGEFARHLWDLAIVQARVELDAERQVVRTQVAKAEADADHALQARDAALHQITDVERRLTVAHRAREEVERKLAEAGARSGELKNQLAALSAAHAATEKQLLEANAKWLEADRQIADLQKALDRAVAATEQDAKRHEQQLERAKQHYAELESELGAVLQHHKTARQKLEKNLTGRDKE